MHVAEKCITDLRSALAVAKALKVDTVMVDKHTYEKIVKEVRHNYQGLFSYTDVSINPDTGEWVSPKKLGIRPKGTLRISCDGWV